MRSYNHRQFQEQASFLRRQFLQGGELPFASVLSEGIISQALAAIDVVWLDRIYSPLVTLWVFLGQVLSRDHSCRAAVARLIAHRVTASDRAQTTSCSKQGLRARFQVLIVAPLMRDPQWRDTCPTLQGSAVTLRELQRNIYHLLDHDQRKPTSL